MQVEAIQRENIGPLPRGKQIAALALLNLFLFAFAPFFVLKKLHRVSRKRSRHELDWRRWFVTPVRPDVPLAPLSGPRIVLVGPTFGELRIMEAVSRQLKKARPDANIIWCIRDLATIELVKANHPNQAVVIWPFDNAFPVLKWTRMVKPDYVIITEKFWLPNLISISHLSGARLAVINGRTNRRDRAGDKIRAHYYRWITHNVDVLCLQAPVFFDRLAGLLRPTSLTTLTGNIKLDLEVAPIDQARADSIEKWLATRGSLPLLAAGSTATEIDEEFVFSAFDKVRAQVPCALLIAPRKSQRWPVTAEAAQKRGYKVSKRTAPSDEQADVYVLDTLGELSHCYQYAEAAFIGGTIVSTGHNVVEPVLWGKPVAYGPLRGHFEDLQIMCERFKVGFRCQTSDDLAAMWLRALTDQAFLEEASKKSKEMLSSERGATEKTTEALLTMISK